MARVLQMLASLAICRISAGASGEPQDGSACRTPADQPGPECDQDSGCFPASATVQGIGGSIKRVADLAWGDMVATTCQARICFEPWLYDFHARDFHSLGGQQNALASFVDIAHEHGNLRLTKDHNLFVDKAGVQMYISAGDVRVGDLLYVAETNASQLGLSAVKSVSQRFEKGVYAPLTLSGRLLIDGVLVSSFTTEESLSMLCPQRFWEAAALLITAPIRYYQYYLFAYVPYGFDVVYVADTLACIGLVLFVAIARRRVGSKINNLNRDDTIQDSEREIGP